MRIKLVDVAPNWNLLRLRNERKLAEDSTCILSALYHTFYIPGRTSEYSDVKEKRN